jgi:dTDP-4-dehydrorhamnose reductase
MYRILITGGTGLLGINWALARRDRDEIMLVMHNRKVNIENIFLEKIDLFSFIDIYLAIKKFKPDFVVHAASLTSVEECEDNVSLAEKVNIDLALNVAAACNKLKIKLVHISTDHLFSGDKPFVDEKQATNPRNTYGLTKARAEQQVQRVNLGSLIVRTNFYGWGPSYRQSFSDIIINSLRNLSEIHLFNDVFYTPILIELLIEKIENLISINASGIFNIVGDDRVTKYQFGLALAKEFNLDNNLIKPISILTRKELTLRPLDMSLSNRKVSNQINSKLAGIEDHIKKLRMQELRGFSQEIQKL